MSKEIRRCTNNANSGLTARKAVLSNVVLGHHCIPSIGVLSEDFMVLYKSLFAVSIMVRSFATQTTYDDGGSTGSPRKARTRLGKED